MSIKYSVLPMKNPLRLEEPEKFYARAQSRSTITEDRIADDIAYATSLTKGDVANVLRVLPRFMKKYLEDGDIIDLGDLGKFQYQVMSKGAFTREEFTHYNIRKAKLQYRPSMAIKESLENLEFEEVISLKAKQEAMRKAKKGE